MMKIYLGWMLSDDHGWQGDAMAMEDNYIGMFPWDVNIMRVSIIIRVVVLVRRSHRHVVAEYWRLSSNTVEPQPPSSWR